MGGDVVMRSEDLDWCFENMMMVGSGSYVSQGGMKMNGMVITEWKDIPVELLMRIVSLTDDRTVISAAGVCCGWRASICQGLQHLCLSWCNKNMNNLVLSLVPKFTRLQSLALRQGKPQLEDEAVTTVAMNCPDLRELDLSRSLWLTDTSLDALALCCPNLIKLNLSGCSMFTDDGLIHLTNHCRKLKVLNLCGCERAATDRTLMAIGRNCSQLQVLNLGWCEYVSDTGVTRLAYGCPDLRTLDLCGCVNITDDSVVALAMRCRYLTSLGLYYCRNITDKSMYSLVHSRVKNNPGVWESMKKAGFEREGLRSLNISQCTMLTPPAVQALCDCFPELHTCSGRHSLVMSGCLSLTSVHCACANEAPRDRLLTYLSNPAH